MVKMEARKVVAASMIKFGIRSMQLYDYDLSKVFSYMFSFITSIEVRMEAKNDDTMVSKK